jgi:TetR/AcrR family transcriptional regulator, transcriptional repressor for nem operon
MRVSRAQAEENRQNVIDVASRLFREHGFDGIGLKDLMESAGLTQGAFYKQFESKEALVAEASARAVECASARWSKAVETNPEDPLGAILDFYLSKGHRKERMDGCPLVALGADAARQSADVKAEFEAGIRKQLEFLTHILSESGRAKKCEKKAMSIASTMVGAVTLARVVNDPRLAQSILDAAAESIRDAASS